MQDAGKGPRGALGAGPGPRKPKATLAFRSPWLPCPYHGHLFRSLGLSEEQGGCAFAGGCRLRGTRLEGIQAQAQAPTLG